MKETLQKYFGYKEFHPLQEEIINDVLKKHDVLVLMPTGGGKSLCYQLPALLEGGITVVISPLISLMKDQVDALKSIGIPAAFINSSLHYSEIFKVKNQLINNHIKLLYIAPERIMLSNYLDFLHRLDLSLIAIDEAHCISEWGHDFRPEYRKLSLLKEKFPDIPVIALTSTANRNVQNDIITQLNMQNNKVYRASLDRKNLFYDIRTNKKGMYGQILEYIENHHGDSGIIYCHSRKSTEDMAEKLNMDGIRAVPYHAGLSNEKRAENQKKFIQDDIEVVVATIAFGMGINKSNVRYVIHSDMPKSIEGYYQETGRAGRDSLRSDCILFYNYGDKIKHEYFIKQIEDDQYRRVAYNKMWDIVKFCKSERCRRITLLNYFGERYHEVDCKMCDICTPIEKETVKKKSKIRRQSEYVLPKAKRDIGYRSGEFDQKLFDILRALRKQTADKEGMPPYIVFSDKALRDMAAKYPKDSGSFLDINGVGEAKLNKYGKMFIEVIVKYCHDENSKVKQLGGLNVG